MNPLYIKLFRIPNWSPMRALSASCLLCAKKRVQATTDSFINFLEFEYICGPTTLVTKSVFPKLSSLFDTNMISNVIRVNLAENLFTQSIYANSINRVLKNSSPTKVCDYHSYQSSRYRSLHYAALHLYLMRPPINRIPISKRLFNSIPYLFHAPCLINSSLH